MSNLTLEDIAKKAGVSRSTVLHVVNDHSNVHEEVRMQVWKVIKDLDTTLIRQIAHLHHSNPR